MLGITCYKDRKCLLQKNQTIGKLFYRYGTKQNLDSVFFHRLDQIRGSGFPKLTWIPYKVTWFLAQ